MNAPYKWIKEYCAVNDTPHGFAQRMTMTGTKTEGFFSAADSVKNVVTGRVTAIERHPNADKLLVCSVDAGKPLRIVTAAKNLTVGDIVPVALDGSLLANGAEIHSGELRGVLSQGMFCSIAELGVTLADFPDCVEDGIMTLPADTPIGADITAVCGLDDTVFEFEITSNRPDCLSVSGIAREAAATYGVPFVFPKPANRPMDGEIGELLSVAVKEPSLCCRYTAALLKDVKIEPSPLWMRTRLRECGLRPINNIVDITNYVMLEYNQPMHAFDLRNVKDSHIIVRRAKRGEEITTLDDTAHSLTEKMLVIADAEKPIAVAGVMGGEYSGIYADTNTVVFESACFEPMNNRATSTALSLRTDSSIRFEKGLDPNNTMPALLRALELCEQIGAGKVVSGIIDIKGDIKKTASYPLSPDRVNAFLGTEIPVVDMKKYLEALEFTVSDELMVTPPDFRRDIEGFADIAEEIARMHGYDRIPNTVMSGIATASWTERQRFLRRVTERCVECGLFEIQTSSFLNPRAFSQLMLPDDSELRRAVRIINPFGEETSLMRTTGLASMLDVLVTNYKARVEKAELFEIAREYIASSDDSELPLERDRLIVGCYGGADFYRVKGVVESLLDMSGISDAEFIAEKSGGFYHPGRAAKVVCRGETIGVFGELHPEIVKNYGIKTRVIAAELDMDTLFALHGGTKKYAGLPRFPALTRDLAFVCGEGVLSSEIEAVIRLSCGELLERVTVFDVYQGEQLPKGKKSIAYGVTLRAADRTLTDSEADTAINAVLDALKLKDITLRA